MQKYVKNRIDFMKLCLMMQEDAECLLIKLWRHWQSYCKSYLKRGIQDFHMNYVLVPADKAANNVVVV